MTIRAGRNKRRSQLDAVTTAIPGWSQNQIPSESEHITTVPNGSRDEQQATTVNSANGPVANRVGVRVEIAATIQRIERDLIELKRQLRNLDWARIDQA